MPESSYAVLLNLLALCLVENEGPSVYLTCLGPVDVPTSASEREDVVKVVLVCPAKEL